jgi:hypothetical protein
MRANGGMSGIVGEHQHCQNPATGAAIPAAPDDGSLRYRGHGKADSYGSRVKRFIILARFPFVSFMPFCASPEKKGCYVRMNGLGVGLALDVTSIK